MCAHVFSSVFSLRDSLERNLRICNTFRDIIAEKITEISHLQPTKAQFHSDLWQENSSLRRNRHFSSLKLPRIKPTKKALWKTLKISIVVQKFLFRGHILKCNQHNENNYTLCNCLKRNCTKLSVFVSSENCESKGTDLRLAQFLANINYWKVRKNYLK